MYKARLVIKYFKQNEDIILILIHRINTNNFSLQLHIIISL